MATYFYLEDSGSTRSQPKRAQRCILHMDGDAFFVGVEVAKNPKLRGLPVVTGEERGIVSALSYEAKALGIIRGLPIYRVKKDFPQVIILPGDYASYARYSSKMFDIVRRYADDVEEYSIDECFADLTGLEAPLKMSYEQIARRIKQEIADELDLSVSIGLAPTKVLAKVASKWQKPNGFTMIGLEPAVANASTPTPHDFLAKLPVGKVWGIGTQTSAALIRQGVFTADDFARKDAAWVKAHFSKPYEAIWLELNGVSVMPIDPLPKTVYSSVQKTRSFHPATNDRVFLLSQLSKHIEDACTKARHYNLMPKKVSFFLKTKDFRYMTYSATLLSPTNAPESIIALAAKEFGAMHKPGVLYRTTGVTLYELVSSDIRQSDFFGNSAQAEKFERIHHQIDSLEHKFGRRAVYLASTHTALQRKEKGTDVEDLDRDLLFL